MPTLARRMFAEFLGTALLVAGVIGSGIAASQLSPGDVGLQLLENTLATAGVLVAVILAVGPVSGAHLNPVITLVDRILGGVGWPESVAYISAQTAGGFVGALVANAMFGHALLELSTKSRSSGPLWFAESVATFGLVLVVFAVVRSGKSSVAPFAVASYIAGAYFFTASTSFANPAVTFARMFSESFAGISPSSVGPFIAFQIVGGAAGLVAVRVLYPGVTDTSSEAVVQHVQSNS